MNEYDIDKLLTTIFVTALVVAGAFGLWVFG